LILSHVAIVCLVGYSLYKAENRKNSENTGEKSNRIENELCYLSELLTVLIRASFSLSAVWFAFIWLLL